MSHLFISLPTGTPPYKHPHCDVYGGGRGGEYGGWEGSRVTQADLGDALDLQLQQVHSAGGAIQATPSPEQEERGSVCGREGGNGGSVGGEGGGVVYWTHDGNERPLMATSIALPGNSITLYVQASPPPPQPQMMMAFATP